jgi:hypothetical protein
MPRTSTGLGVRDLAHDIQIMNTAINKWRCCFHQLLVGFPMGAGGLLVEVHAEHIRATECARLGNQPDPGRVMAKDVADDQFAPCALCGLDNPQRVFNGRCHRLFEEDMGSGFHGSNRKLGMAVGIGVDRAEVWFDLRQRRLEFGQQGIGIERRVHRRFRPVDQRGTISKPGLL